MKCKNCSACINGFYGKDSYICTGVKEPFVINDIEKECTEYPNYNAETIKSPVYVEQRPYVSDDGIYEPMQPYIEEGRTSAYRLIISREMFVEAYNKWIKNEDKIDISIDKNIIAQCITRISNNKDDRVEGRENE